MILGRPDDTPYDLRFTLFGTPIRVHPLFWLTALFLGSPLLSPPFRFSENGVPEVLIWVVAVMVSIILHEFGHVWMWRVFGTRAKIQLNGMGGLAIPTTGGRAFGWRYILVCFAGPAIQLLFAAALYGGWLYRSRIRDYPALTFLLEMLLLINLFWALFNLLPIYPLDGGQIAREGLQMSAGRKGLIASLWLSVATCALIGLNALLPLLGQERLIWFLPGGPLTAIMCVVFAVAALQELQRQQSFRRGPFDDDW